MTKKFECEDGCKNQIIDQVVYSCEDCIKHTAIHISPEKFKIIERIVFEKE